MTNEKLCKCCGTIKPLEGFTKAKAMTDGRRNKCKQCTNAATKFAVQAYRKRNIEKVRAQQKQSYYADVEETRSKNRIKHHANKEKRAESAKKYAQANKEKRKVWDRAWRAAHREYEIKRLEKKRSLPRNLSEFDKFVLKEAAHLCAVREKVVGGKWEIDHIIPVSKGGTSEHFNIQVAPKAWNASKGNRHTNKYLG